MELDQAHIVAQQRLRDLLTAAVLRAWDGLPGHDRADVDEWLTTVLPLVTGAQRQSAALTEAYIARALRRAPRGIPIGDVTGAAVRAGTTPEDVYTRPFITFWSALKNGDDFAAALAAGGARATNAAATDVQLTMRATAAETGSEDDDITGWERVPDGGACSLCLIASTQRYHSDDLMPIHAHCGCGVRPLTGDHGHVINRDLYGRLKAEGEIDKITRQRAAQRDSPDPLEAEVVHHGELGPVLVDPAHHFTVI
jgi:hypothetical protein